MREEEMEVNVAKKIYFDEFNSFYQIAETKDNDYTKEGLNKERIIAIYKALHEDDGYFSTKQIKCYIEYTDKIIDEILKQDVVLGGEQNSSN